MFFAAPSSGCLQYFTAASGQFTSFNYKTTEADANGPNHLANLNYAICFRIANGFCGIKYSQVASDIYSFTLSGDASTLKKLQTSGVMYSDSKCKKDYLVIPGGSQTGLDSDRKSWKDRFCGLTLGVCGNGQNQACTAVVGPVVSKFENRYQHIFSNFNWLFFFSSVYQTLYHSCSD